MVSTTVRPDSFSPDSRSHRLRRACGSRAAVGSSRKTTSGLVHQGTGDRQPLRLATGEVLGPRVGLVRQTDPLQPGVGAARASTPYSAAKVRICSRVVSRSKYAVVCSCTPIGGSSAELRGHGPLPEQPHLAAVGPAQPLDHLQRRGLPGAVRARGSRRTRPRRPRSRPRRRPGSRRRRGPGPPPRSQPCADRRPPLSSAGEQRTRTTRSATDIRARSAVSSAQIWSNVAAARATTSRRRPPRRPPGSAASAAASVHASTWAVSWACTACRSSRSAARAIVCQRSLRGSARIRETSIGRPSRSPRAKCTRATSSGSISARAAVCTMPSTMYAGGHTATRAARSSGTSRRTRASRRAS